MAQATSINSDEFSNFSFTPPRPRGRLRSFSRPHRSKYYAMTPNASASKKFGSNTSLTSFGSTQDLTLDSSRQMDLSEDAKSHKISAEVMKHRLYESVITSPRRRRFSHRSDYWSGDGGFYGMARMAQSLPVTPAMTPAVTPGHSQNTSPTHSPRGSRRFMFGLFSRDQQEEDDTMQVELNESLGARGLATILKPHPKYIAAHQSRWNRGEKNAAQPDEEPMQTDDLDGRMNVSFPPPEHPAFINRLAVGDRDTWFHRTGKTPLIPGSTSPTQGYAVAKEDRDLQPPTF